ncbi:MAG: hypothetical protein WCD49_02175 [Candidatus Acidiferrales bacterium]
MPDPALYKKLYEILKWSSVAALALTLILVLHTSPAPNIPYNANAAASAEKKFEAADQAKAAGQPSQVQLDRSELNSYLAQNLQLEGKPGPGPASAAGPPQAASLDNVPTVGSAVPPDDPAGAFPGGEQATLEQVQSTVKDVKVDMDGDLVKAYVIFDYHGKDLSLELDGHLSADGGYMKFEPVAGKLGSLPLPQSTLQAAVDKMMASPENREKLKLPADISDIQIQNGQAVVKYK